jgi:hypothetical protein
MNNREPARNIRMAPIEWFDPADNTLMDSTRLNDASPIPHF